MKNKWRLENKKLKEMDISEYSYKNGYEEGYFRGYTTGHLGGLTRALVGVESALESIGQPVNDFDWGRRAALLETFNAIQEVIEKHEKETAESKNV